MRRRAALLALLAAGAAGCGGGTPVDQARDVAAFDRLVVADGLDVAVVRGDQPGVRVHGGDQVVDRVETESADGRLRVGVHDRGIVIGPDPMDDVRVRVTVPRLRDAEIDGRGDLDLGDVEIAALRLEIHGAGGGVATGRVGTLTAVIHGSGDVDFSRLAARSARVEISGSGDVDLDVSDDLAVEIHGSGDVRYRGHPAVHSEIHGSGDVTRVPASPPA